VTTDELPSFSAIHVSAPPFMRPPIIAPSKDKQPADRWAFLVDALVQTGRASSDRFQTAMPLGGAASALICVRYRIFRPSVGENLRMIARGLDRAVDSFHTTRRLFVSIVCVLKLHVRPKSYARQRPHTRGLSEVRSFYIIDRLLKFVYIATTRTPSGFFGTSVASPAAMRFGFEQQT